MATISYFLVVGCCDVDRSNGRASPGDERGLSFRHDGCVRVDDDGATGEVLELWVASPSYGDQVDDRLTGAQSVDVYQDSAYCER